MTYTSLVSLTAAFICKQQPVFSDEFGFPFTPWLMPVKKKKVTLMSKKVAKNFKKNTDMAILVKFLFVVIPTKTFTLKRMNVNSLF